MLAATMVLTSVPVLAASGTKTAVLNTAKVSFNGGPVQNIQCYNIDGYNYVRARDITNNLNMWIFDYKNGKTGLMVDSTAEPESKKPMEKLTQKNATVQMKNAELAYNSFVINTECFLLNGRYYFKLADFAAASDNALEREKVGIEISANAGIVDEPNKQSFDGVSVQWNNDTKVIDVKRTTTDLLKIFNDIRANGGNPVATKPSETEGNTNNTASNNMQSTEIGVDSQGKPIPEGFENHQPQLPLTSAPKEGEVLANILIDESKGAYLDKGMTKINKDNFNIPYRNSGSVGQCTWYVMGRFTEVTGIDLESNHNSFVFNPLDKWVAEANNEYNSDVYGITDPEQIVPKSIGIWDGHVVFIEWVDYDSNNQAETVYFTEANWNHYGDIKEGVFYPDYDGKVKKMQFDTFLKRGGKKFIGYVVAK